MSLQELFYMASMYHGSLGTKENRNESIKLYQSAGDGGHLKGYINLGYWYRERGENEFAIIYFEKTIEHQDGNVILTIC